MNQEEEVIEGEFELVESDDHLKFLFKEDWGHFTFWIKELKHYIHTAGEGSVSYTGKLVGEIYDAVYDLDQRRTPTLLPPAIVGRGTNFGIRGAFGNDAAISPRDYIDYDKMPYNPENLDV